VWVRVPPPAPRLRRCNICLLATPASLSSVSTICFRVPSISDWLRWPFGFPNSLARASSCLIQGYDMGRPVAVDRGTRSHCCKRSAGLCARMGCDASSAASGCVSTKSSLTQRCDTATRGTLTDSERCGFSVEGCVNTKWSPDTALRPDTAPGRRFSGEIQRDYSGWLGPYFESGIIRIHDGNQFCNQFDPSSRRLTATPGCCKPRNGSWDHTRFARP
jgi:hypothetical protein